MNPYFPANEFPAKDRDVAIEEGMQVLRMIASGRSVGSCLTPDECRTAYPVVWQMLHHLQQEEEVRVVREEVFAPIHFEPLDRSGLEFQSVELEAEKAVMETLGIPLEGVKKRTRKMEVVRLRAAVSNALVDSQLCGNSQVARWLGFDHSTMSHARDRHGLYLQSRDYAINYPKLYARFRKLKEGMV